MAYYPRIRDLREDNDLTQTDVAKLLFITQQQFTLPPNNYTLYGKYYKKERKWLNEKIRRNHRCSCKRSNGLKR